MSPKPKSSLTESREREMQWLLSQSSRNGHAERRSEVRALPTPAPVPCPPGFDAGWQLLEGAVRSAPFTEHWMLITPEIAQDWLLHRNTRNRPIRRGRVNAIAKSITLGRYESTHQGVAFSKSGSILDGQHRLGGIVVAGVPVLMRVSFGIDDGAIRVIDADMAARRPGDLLTLRGEENGKDKAAIIRSLVMLETRESKEIAGAVRDATHERFRDAIEWAVNYCSRRRLRAPVCAALAYAYTIEPDKTDALAKTVSSAVGMADGSPALALHSCIQYAGSKGDADTLRLMFKTLRAAECNARGVSIKKLYDTEEGFKHFAAERKRRGLD